MLGEEWSIAYYIYSIKVFSYTANKEIRTDDLCLDVSKLNGPVTMLKCHHLKGNQLWEYDPVVNIISTTWRVYMYCVKTGPVNQIIFTI